MDNELIFRQAQSCETDRIMQIIRQAQARMHAAGSRQWQDGYPAPGHISADIGRNRGYVLCKPGVEGPLSVIAYGAVVFDGEPAYGAIDGAWLTGGDYVVLHRLAVADGEKGRGVAAEFMRRTEALAREQGVGVDLAAFETELQAQKERSRNAAAVDTDDWVELFPIRESVFTGYDTLTERVKIARYRRVTSKGKTSYQLVFDRTPFYGNSGGQIGDIGYIENANERIAVVATEKENGLIIHIVKELPENPAAEFTAVVDAAKRQAAANNHTATHLMHEALRKVLGSHVEQKGSMVTPEILRFDFSHFQKMTPAELRQVEMLVNRAVRANYPLEENREATKEEAEKCGAMMLFGEKYGDKVRMVRFGTSVELCGGTHTSATGNIGFFKILTESAISAGVRRIEAVTGEQAEKIIYAAEDTMRDISEYLHNPQVLQAVKKMFESNETLSKEVEAMRREQVAQWAEKIISSTPERHGVQLIATQTDRTPEFVKDLAYNLRARSPKLVFVQGAVNDGKPMLTVMLGDEITAQGVNAGAVVREAAKLMQGGGGGQAFFATAGGKNPDGLQAAIDKAVELIMAQVK